MGQVLDRPRFVEELCRARAEGRTVVFTNGCFDILHVGHLRALSTARRMGDLLAVAINSDSSVRRIKGAGRPYVPGSERAELVAALEVVGLVTLFDEDTPASLIAQVVPHILVKGGDYRPEDVVGRDTVLASGGRVEIVPLARGRSTTHLVRRLLAAAGAARPAREPDP